MDDAARLVSELHDKLAELDGKVAAYQRDMLAQFHLHMDDCLKQYPAHVSTEVSRVIAASMSKYPALNAPTRRDGSGDVSPRTENCDGNDDNDDDDERKPWEIRDGRKSPPPILYHTSGKPKDGPRSPHQREKEFQGLFTPSYLPLLDSSYHAPQSPPVSPPPTTPLFALSLDALKTVEEPKQPETVMTEKEATRPDPVRRLTDRSSSSLESSGSETKVRRSALRRSSGSTKGASPRRVRFDFEGEEVLPSSSPHSPSAVLTLAGGAEAEKPKPQPQPELEAAPKIVESPAVVELSLLDVEGEEDLLPRPRKVSSTQALQALSRTPLDAGTTWTVVNSDSEELAKTNGNGISGGVEYGADKSAKAKPEVIVLPASTMTEVPRIDELLGSPIEELEEYRDEDASDEEFLSMSTKLSKPSSKATSPVAPFGFSQAPVTRGAATATIKNNMVPIPRTQALLVSDRPGPTQQVDDQDSLFDFDDEEGSNDRSKNEKYLPDAEDEDETPVSERLGLRIAPRANQPTPPLEPDDDLGPLPPVSPSAALFSASLGSYRGQPLKGMGVMKNLNPQLYDDIAGMDNVQALVGSIDDPANIASYRASVARSTLARSGVGATPRSFTERLALEEAMERRRNGDE
ncbi:hypothetical protein OQA88_10436 [Cercophora sp. LCS_1]